MDKAERIPDEVVEILRESGTGMVEDALNLAGLQGGLLGIRPGRGFEGTKLVGLAATALYAAARPDSPKLTNFRVIHESPPGSVLVIDAKGMDGHFTGDNQGLYAKSRGLLGVVVHGGARDIEGYRELGMPLYCTGSATRNKPRTIQLVAYNVPIEVGGISVRPGDIIVADGDGVVAVPIEALPTVLENLHTIAQVEEGLDKAIKAGARIEEIEEIVNRKKPKK